MEIVCNQNKFEFEFKLSSSDCHSIWCCLVPQLTIHMQVNNNLKIAAVKSQSVVKI